MKWIRKTVEFYGIFWNKMNTSNYLFHFPVNIWMQLLDFFWRGGQFCNLAPCCYNISLFFRQVFKKDVIWYLYLDKTKTVELLTTILNEVLLTVAGNLFFFYSRTRKWQISKNIFSMYFTNLVVKTVPEN